MKQNMLKIKVIPVIPSDQGSKCNRAVMPCFDLGAELDDDSGTDSSTDAERDSSTDSETDSNADSATESENQHETEINRQKRAYMCNGLGCDGPCRIENNSPVCNCAPGDGFQFESSTKCLTCPDQG